MMPLEFEIPEAVRRPAELTCSRWALVTGAARGIGRALVGCFVASGWRAFGLVRSEIDSAALRRDISECVPIVSDVTKRDVADDIRVALSSRTTHLDALVNNAGIGGVGRGWDFATTSAEQVAAALDVHCLGAVRCTAAVLDFLRRSPNPVIVNVSSRQGSIARQAGAVPGCIQASYAYRIAKAAQNMFTACLLREIGSSTFRVYAVHPGSVQTRIGLPCADLTPIEAARRIVSLVEQRPDATPGAFVEPGVGVIPW